MRRAAEITSFDDLSAAEYGVAVVQNGGLTGGYSALRRIKMQRYAAVRAGDGCCRLLGLPIANFAVQRIGSDGASPLIQLKP